MQHNRLQNLPGKTPAELQKLIKISSSGEPELTQPLSANEIDILLQGTRSVDNSIYEFLQNVVLEASKSKFKNRLINLIISGQNYLYDIEYISKTDQEITFKMHGQKFTLNLDKYKRNIAKIGSTEINSNIRQRSQPIINTIGQEGYEYLYQGLTYEKFIRVKKNFQEYCNISVEFMDFYNQDTERVDFCSQKTMPDVIAEMIHRLQQQVKIEEANSASQVNTEPVEAKRSLFMSCVMAPFKILMLFVKDIIDMCNKILRRLCNNRMSNAVTDDDLDFEHSGDKLLVNNEHPLTHQKNVMNKQQQTKVLTTQL